MKHLDPAFQILSLYYPDLTQNLKLVMNRFLNSTPVKNRPRVTRLVYGVIRHQNTLDHILTGSLRIPRERVSSDTWIWLRMGLFLLVFSESFPDHAVVNEIVNRCSPGARGFVNAMLRNLARNREGIRHKTGRIKNPRIKYSLSDILISSLGDITDRLNQDLDYLNREPLFHLRPNTCLISLPRLKQILTREKIPFRECAGLQSLEIQNPGQAIRRVLDRGAGYFQNTGSQLVSLIAARYARKRILDGCAAPGTKSITLKLIKPELTVVANDLSLNRLRLINGFEGYDCQGKPALMVSDLRQPALKDWFDLVLVDAPCTASGTLRKNPDLKLKITPSLVRKQSDRQLEILKSIRAGFPAATILYSVCSFIQEETEAVMEKFSAESSGYHLQDLSPLLDAWGFRFRKANQGFYLLPDDNLNNDLFYLALMTP